MEVIRKKIVILGLGDLAATLSGGEKPEDVTDFRIRKDVLDRLCSLKYLSRVVITHGLDEKVYRPMLKAVEFFTFIYCKTAVQYRKSCDDLMETLPHSLRKRELFLSLDRKAAESMDVDYMTLDDFMLCK